MSRPTPTLDAMNNALFVDFLYVLRDYGVPASPKDLLELNQGLEKGLAKDLDDLFVFMRLCFVRRVDHMDAFERAFAFYFFGIDIPPVAEGDMALFRTKQFKDWLRQAIQSGALPERAIYTMSPEELMEKFWKTVREQMEAHQGGSKWVGRGGNSPFGNSGNAERGIRAGGRSINRSAVGVIGERRYVAYSDQTTLRGENLRQALERMKHMRHAGPYSRLNLDETIRRTARNGGEIDLVFERELRDRMDLVLLIDNGGYSMDPFADITRLLFGKMKERFADMRTYYFHNTIYDRVYTDQRRSKPFKVEQLLLRKPDTRVVLFGDAAMAPEELDFPRGSIHMSGHDDPRASAYWLRRIAERFPHSVWLNPLPKREWDTAYGAYTLNKIRTIFHMEDMTLGGVKGMVDRLSDRGR